jgi:hypothetical protein
VRLGEKEEPKRPGSAQPLESYFEDAANLPAHAFETQHGGAFLLLSATGLSGPKGLSGTEVALLSEEDQRAATADIAVLVFPLQAAPGAPGDLITIGREDRNDTVVPDPSISRFHAFLKRTPDGGSSIQDAGSTNGTTVNGASVLARGAGEPTSLKAGDTVRLGQVEFTFLDVPAFRQFALAARG